MPPFLTRAWVFLRTHRKRIAPLVLGAAVMVVGTEWQAHAPDDVELELPVGAGHDEVRQVDVTVADGDELVQRVSLRYPSGAPDHVRHTFELAPGRYDVEVDVVRGDGATETTIGRVDAPAEGVVRVSLHTREGS